MHFRDGVKPAMTNAQSAVDAAKTLRDAFGPALKNEAPLSDYTTLRIGGPAEFLLEAETSEDLIRACRLARRLGLPIRFLAGCSNVLVSDAGLRGLVIINKTNHIEWFSDYTVLVDGGYNLDRFVYEVSRRGWADMTFAAGIPGSLGGALAGGAGAFGNLVHNYLLKAKILRGDGSVATVPVRELGIEYRTSDAKRRGDIIITALMGNYFPGKPEQLLDEIDRIKLERGVKHPHNGLPSAGSFFKNLPPSEPGGRRTPAGKLLEIAGVKSLRFGGAGVFEKHANIIVNHGGATAADVNRLADEMASRVLKRFGIVLEREVQYLSDEEPAVAKLKVL